MNPQEASEPRALTFSDAEEPPSPVDRTPDDTELPAASVTFRIVGAARQESLQEGSPGVTAEMRERFEQIRIEISDAKGLSWRLCRRAGAARERARTLRDA